MMKLFTRIFARKPAVKPATMRVHTDPANDNPPAWRQTAEKWPPEPSLDYYAPKSAEPTTNVIDASALFLMSLPRELQLKLQRHLTHGGGALLRIAA